MPDAPSLRSFLLSHRRTGSALSVMELLSARTGV